MSKEKRVECYLVTTVEGDRTFVNLSDAISYMRERDSMGHEVCMELVKVPMERYVILVQQQRL